MMCRADDLTLTALPVLIRYRYCDRCRREWPADTSHCPNCCLWLDDAPRERTDWQVVPTVDRPAGVARRYENVRTVAVAIRLTGGKPTADVLERIGSALPALFVPFGAGILGVTSEGWLAWTDQPARPAFLMARAFADRVNAALPDLQKMLPPGCRMHWGAWVDDCILRLARTPLGPQISEAAGRALFDFQPGDMLLTTEPIFGINLRWENFVCIPARRHDGGVRDGYRWLDRKRPSAIDHARVADAAAFLGRETELNGVEQAYRRPGGAVQAIIAEAGTGKTRLVNAWIAQHPGTHVLRANFSIFGGDLPSFVAQMVTLPEGSHEVPVLVDTVATAIVRDRVDVLVLDDLHWADDESWRFLRALLSAARRMVRLIVVCTRPGPRVDSELATLRPDSVMRLPPLPPVDTAALALALGAEPRIVRIAAESGGNPLYIEHLVAWSKEAGRADRPIPATLHEAVLARLDWLEQVRVGHVRRRASLAPGWMREEVAGELAAIESDIGLWLDRLETGDYADRVLTSAYLGRLKRIEFELFVTAAIIGRARPRSPRLREAIDRLLIGSAGVLLADMEARSAAGQRKENAALAQEAEHAGLCAAEHYLWDIALRFLAVAREALPAWRRAELAERIRTIRVLVGRDPFVPRRRDIVSELECHPSITPLGLPESWLALAEHFQDADYAARGACAARAIGAGGLAAMADQAIVRLMPQPVANATG